MEYLEWVQALNQQSHLSLSLNSKFLTLALYFVTWNRSKLYALAFLFVSAFDSNLINSLINVNSNYYGFQYYSLLTSIDCILFALILTTTNSKSQRIICGMIVTLDVLMAIGYLVGGDAALFIYDNYENIVFCLHVMLILSLYKPKPILRALVDKLLDFFRAVDSIIFMRAFWYTKEISKQEFKLS
tara:strand:- start:43236 stop:43793 length:558 start_codon:yes stop_codon:yes gene_type:complete